MPTLDDVYRKFGEVSEAAQLLETGLGNLLITAGVVENNLLENQDTKRASELFKSINRKTLGQLIRTAKRETESIDELEGLLSHALSERNRLSHSFYRHHNFRRNSEDGRLLMLNDLESIHETLLEAYKAVLKLSGFDLDSVELSGLHQKHLPI